MEVDRLLVGYTQIFLSSPYESVLGMVKAIGSRLGLVDEGGKMIAPK